LNNVINSLPTPDPAFVSELKNMIETAKKW